MHLLNASTLQLEEFNDDDRPPYAILSHRWQTEEITYRDIMDDTGNTKKGFGKLRMACKRAIWDNLSHIWIDTCCIDKSSSAELSEAINSMYRWYADANRCYVYLFDVSNPQPGEDVTFSHATWFQRSWTLQELIAPRAVYFYDRDWRVFGTRQSLSDELSIITQIPINNLRPSTLEDFSIAQRMSWAAGRMATRKEDIAYSLMGIFNVNMPLLYGEGEKAFTRLQEEIIKKSTDRSILLWDYQRPFYGRSYRVLAKNPADFIRLDNWYDMEIPDIDEPFQITNAGLEMEVEIVCRGAYEYIAICYRVRSEHSYAVLLLRLIDLRGKKPVFVKVGASILPDHTVASAHVFRREVHLNILSYPRSGARETLNGFAVRDGPPCGKTQCQIHNRSVNIQGQKDESTDYWIKPLDYHDWVCSIEVVFQDINLHEKKHILTFRLGFDFWSRPFCHCSLRSGANLDTPEESVSISDFLEHDDTDYPSMGLQFVPFQEVSQNTQWVLRASFDQPQISIFNTPFDFQITMEMNSYEYKRYWVFTLPHHVNSKKPESALRD